MLEETRRQFLGTTGAAAALPAAQQTPRFRPASQPKRLSDNLYLLEDTCNVFVVKQGTRAVLIDFGSGAILDHLPALGVQSVDWVLHTHHHRDQCQGDHLLAARRIPVAVPAHEAHLFADAENFWRNRRVFHLYYVRNDFNTLTKNIRVDRRLADYSTFRWQGLDFFVLPTPGHTLGSLTLLATIDGKRTAFTGDLMYAPGKILNLYDTQINYGGSEGIDLGIFSLARLAEQKPDLVCPSHGEPLADPANAILETRKHLTEYYRFQTGNSPVEEGLPLAVSPHLVAHYLTTSSFYAIISESGKALFIDYGSASGVHFGNFERATAVTDRIRFVEHSIARLRRDHGLKSIDVAMPSHMHDDHMNGFPHLKRHFGTKVWCYENMVDVFENPRGYNLGCILAEPVKIDRAFRDGETFRWEEFEFEVKHSPGHTPHADGPAARDPLSRPRPPIPRDAATAQRHRTQDAPAAAVLRQPAAGGRNRLRPEPQLAAPLAVSDVDRAGRHREARNPREQLRRRADEARSGAGGAARMAARSRDHHAARARAGHGEKGSRGASARRLAGARTAFRDRGGCDARRPLHRPDYRSRRRPARIARRGSEHQAHAELDLPGIECRHAPGAEAVVLHHARLDAARRLRGKERGAQSAVQLRAE
nr:MBL fold metallo-hydrolase [Bryobacter sp.]